MGQQHSYKQANYIGDGQVPVSGSFIWTGAAITGVRGKGFTITRTAGGTFKVTLDTSYQQILAGDASLMLPLTPNNFTSNVAILQSVFADSANTQITLWTLDNTGNPADPAATTRVSFDIILSNSVLNT